MATRTSFLSLGRAALRSQKNSISTKSFFSTSSIANQETITAEDVIASRIRIQTLEKELESLGSTQTKENTFRANDSLTKPKSAEEISISNLIAAGCHLGQSSRLSNVSGHSFTYGVRNGTCIIDVRQTLSHLRRAARVVKQVVEKDGIVLFLTHLPGSERAAHVNAKRLGPNGYASTNWVAGTLTNPDHVYTYPKLPKSRDISVERQSLYTNEKRVPRDFTPSIIISLSPRLNQTAIREANIANVVTIGVVDTDVDPRAVTYPIPCNDDSIRAIELVAGVLGRAGQQGLENRRRREAQFKQMLQQTDDQPESTKEEDKN